MTNKSRPVFFKKIYPHWINQCTGSTAERQIWSERSRCDTTIISKYEICASKKLQHVLCSIFKLSLLRIWEMGIGMGSFFHVSACENSWLFIVCPLRQLEKVQLSHEVCFLASYCILHHRRTHCVKSEVRMCWRITAQLPRDKHVTCAVKQTSHQPPQFCVTYN